MQKMKLFTGILLLLTVLLPGTAPAADDDRVKLEMTIAKQMIAVVDGREQISYVPAAEVSLGDIVRYEITFANTSNEEVYNFAIIDPIPAGVVFLEANGVPETTTLFSINKGFIYQEPPLYYDRIEKDGTRTRQEAGPEMYTHIKWQFTKAIMPGQKGNVSFTARVQ